jgi:hypothetical protein
MSRNHAGIKSTLDQFATPVVGTAAGLHRDQTARRQISTPKQKLFSLQSAVSEHITARIHCMHLNHIFGQINADSGYLTHGTSPSAWVLRLTFLQSNLGIQRLFDGSGKSLRIHIGVDADSGLVHTVRGTAGHVADVTEGSSLLHGEETVVFADAGYQGANKRPDAHPGVRWHVAMHPGKRKKLDKAGSPIYALMANP